MPPISTKLLASTRDSIRSLADNFAHLQPSTFCIIVYIKLKFYPIVIVTLFQPLGNNYLNYFFKFLIYCKKMSGGLFMKQKKCFAILLLCALTAFHILWDRQFSSTDSSDFVPVLPEPVIQINAMEQTPNPLILHA